MTVEDVGDETLSLPVAFLFQVDCALSLIRLGMERNIPGLLVLCDNLVTLEALVYEAGCDLTLTLKELQQMKDIEKLRLLMSSVCFILPFCVLGLMWVSKPKIKWSPNLRI